MNSQIDDTRRKGYLDLKKDAVCLLSSRKSDYHSSLHKISKPANLHDPSPSQVKKFRLDLFKPEESMRQDPIAKTIV